MSYNFVSAKLVLFIRCKISIWKNKFVDLFATSFKMTQLFNFIAVENSPKSRRFGKDINMRNI